MKNKKILSMIAIAFSVLAAIMSAVVNFTQQTIWLAGTQWILIAILLAVYAVYLNSCACKIETGQEN